ncbi:hypothetical protein Agub_g10407, partial [Astrephomene gubernaculifera]
MRRPSSAVTPVSGDGPSLDTPPFLPQTSSTHSSSVTTSTSQRMTVKRDDSDRLSYPWQVDQQPDIVRDNFKGFWTNTKESYKRKVETYTWLDWLGFFLPCVRWLRTYKIKEYLLADLVAGISVGFMVVPQGMSYANLAGLPSVYGLYGAFL